VNANPDNLDRGLCLTVGAGEAAGASCGDLFVVHAMPVYRTLGRDRALSLYYNSAAATALLLLPANVSEPSNIATPDRIKVILTVGTSKDSAEYQPPLTWPYDGPRQIVLGRALAAQPTGLYAVTLLVRNIYGVDSVGVYDTTITRTALIVNRSQSEFGQGWSALGVEQILFDPSDSTRLVWLAGDGSIRVYQKPVPSSNLFQAAPGDAPDSLVRLDTLGTMWYRRELKHRAAVLFDQTGRHRVTQNRIGARTIFTWGSIAGQTRLMTIGVPPNGNPQHRYALYWNPTTALLDSLVDPYGRALRATITNSQLTRLVQATLFPTDDADTTAFEYDGGRLTRRVAESSALASGFVGTVYAYQKSARLTLVKIPSGQTGSDTARIALSPWDEQGLALAYSNQQAAATLADTALPTRVDGPLAGTGDAADFWVNRFGQPIKSVQLGLAATTRVWRDSVGTPALPTKVQSPNNRIMRMSWNPRGNLVEMRDSSAGLVTKVTTYAYGDPVNAPDSPTRVSDAFGRHTDFAYNGLGVTDSVIEPRGSRTKFFYRSIGNPADSLQGVVDSVGARAVETWWESDASEHLQDQVNRFNYDGLGNVVSWTSAVGVTTTFARNQAGMINEAWDPLGYHRIWANDGFNRVLGYEQRTGKENPPNSNPLLNCDLRQVVCSDQTAPFLPASDFLSALSSQFRYNDDGLSYTADPRTVERTFGYDARGQLSSETDDIPLTRYAYFNLAGSVDSTKSRSGVVVRYRYDAIGRRTAMIFPVVKLPTQGAGYEANAADSVYGDSVSYAYDIMGNVIQAKNRYSTIIRTYNSDNSVRTQVTVIGGETDSLSFLYDAAGARTRLAHVRVSAGTKDTVRYFYGATTGDLDSMVVSWSGVSGARKVAFLWDRLGRRRLLTYPSGITVALRYDAAGIVRRVISSNPATPAGADRFDFTFKNDQVDPAGRILHQDILCNWTGTNEDPIGVACGPGPRLTTTNRYNRFGMLVYQERSGSSVTLDSMRYDRSGNLIYQRDGATGNRYDYHMFVHSNGKKSNLLDWRWNDGTIDRTYSVTYDAARKQEHDAPQVNLKARYYYDGVQRASAVIKVGVPNTPSPNSCQYDADGQMAHPCDNMAPWLTFDGHNVAAAGGFVFASGPAVDDPLLGVYRGSCLATPTEFSWVTDGQGRQFAVGRTDGSFPPTTLNCFRNNGGTHAGGTQNAYGFSADRFGSANIPKVSLFRNRVYDQETGRWLQEDPIGVAGGLNLFQYVGNDPVTHTDPFGLQACTGRLTSAVWACLGRQLEPLQQVVHVYSAGVAVVMTGGIAAELAAAATPTALALGPAAGGLPMVPSAVPKLATLAQRFGTTVNDLASKVVSQGQRFADMRHGGNINALLQRPDGASGFVRVTLDPAGKRIISAGMMRADQVADLVSAGKMVPLH
jgi:RHS repeat-associated protein